MNAGQFFFLALFLTFLIFVLPVILIEFEIIPTEVTQGLLKVKEVLLIKVLGYSEEASKFPAVIFNVILPFGICLAVILIFMDFFHTHIFPRVSSSLFYLLAWLMALASTRFFGPIITGFFTGLGFYATIAFGAILIIVIAIAFKLTGAGLKGLIMAGIIGILFSFMALFMLDYLGLTNIGFQNIMTISVITMILSVAVTYLYQRQLRNVGGKILDDINYQIDILRDRHASIMAKAQQAPNLQEFQKLMELAKEIETKIEALEERKRRFLVEQA